MLFWILLASILGGVGAIGLAAIFLLLPQQTQNKSIPSLVAFATGTLLASACLGMLPHAIESLPIENAMITFLGGLIAFFVLEKLIIWRHCHHTDCDVHHASGTLILIGDAFHNCVDGIVIAGAFLINPLLGILTTVSVFAHELPQELGDFGILLRSGYTPQKALLYNTISSLSAILGSLGGYFALSRVEIFIPYVLCISAASFIYIALSDLAPEAHNHCENKKQHLTQILFVLLGILVIAGTLRFHQHPESHSHQDAKEHPAEYQD